MAQKTDRGFVYNNPGIIAALVATVIGVGFVFILVNGAGHHEGGHGAAPHGAAPAASAPAASAPAASAPAHH